MIVEVSSCYPTLPVLEPSTAAEEIAKIFLVNRSYKLIFKLGLAAMFVISKLH